MPQVTYLELSAGQEHKFYEVTVDGASLTIRYGRIGTEGQTQRKTLADAVGAQAEAEKKLAEKRKKGYADAVKGQTAKKSVAETATELPRELEPYRQKIEATIKPAVHLSLRGRPEHLWESKVGGVPYRPKGAKWPKTPNGKPLVFLAQLNFAELPHLPDFPESGLLQFFIGPDNTYGLKFGDPADNMKQRSFRVIYHEQVTEDPEQLEQTVLRADKLSSPLNEGVNWRLQGELVHWPMTAEDHEFEAKTGLDFWADEARSEARTLELLEKYSRYAHGGHPGLGWHQVGGYPTFTQDDPREANSELVLLFQLDSEDKYGIMWGDVGVGNFFIRLADLKKRDFSRVLYNWDCG